MARDKEKHKASCKRWRETNKEKYKASWKRRYEANKERYKASRKLWYEANKERYKASKKRSREANKEDIKKRRAANRARMTAAHNSSKGSTWTKTEQQTTKQSENINDATLTKKAVTGPSHSENRIDAKKSLISSGQVKPQAKLLQDQQAKITQPPPLPLHTQKAAPIVPPSTVIYLDPVVFSLKVHKKSFPHNACIEFTLIVEEYNFVGVEQGCTSCHFQRAIFPSSKYVAKGDQGPRMCTSCRELIFLRHCGHLWKNQDSSKTTSIPRTGSPRIVEEFVV
ncbi:hypothetical protein H310_10780 [Aphanomyces invadans]|uniref:Uncharacterized protein n=1 Tax=Aphanomyces invadans TaxID=157072 RepID=A0A024TS10_9STRA|nr:hypothetical protein H310_10780 [Aphanomyces invadans]ETV96147.1 hypothetical protein H310_10780 [Aphanomyces invadans]|eukprot:XP_008875458.1 hypothetical protein H310_10780 [Aphanomyces invadans]